MKIKNVNQTETILIQFQKQLMMNKNQLTVKKTVSIFFFISNEKNGEQLIQNNLNPFDSANLADVQNKSNSVSISPTQPTTTEVVKQAETFETSKILKKKLDTLTKENKQLKEENITKKTRIAELEKENKNKSDEIFCLRIKIDFLEGKRKTASELNNYLPPIPSGNEKRKSVSDLNNLATTSSKEKRVSNLFVLFI